MNNALFYLPESMCNEIDGSLTMYEGLGTLSIENNKFCENEEHAWAKAGFTWINDAEHPQWEGFYGREQK